LASAGSSTLRQLFIWTNRYHNNDLTDKARPETKQAGPGSGDLTSTASVAAARSVTIQRTGNQRRRVAGGPTPDS
jgi:hypothetical protein